MLAELRQKLTYLSNLEDALFLQRFFKTAPGQYGEGDIFRGIRVPVLRRLSKEYRLIHLDQVISLLQSAFHEDRLLALFILILKYAKANSRSMWERRIAILATFHFIKREKFDETLKIAEILLADKEDLIHKAVGWMLREVGKRDAECEESFLNCHYQQMPRTMLRYAIEKYSQEKRLDYLKRH